MNILVTGGAGFIGSNFVHYWVEHHPDDVVVAYDALTYAGNLPNLADVEDRIAFVHGDVCDTGFALETLRSHEIDTVVHFAAESHNSLAVLDPERFFRTNVLGTQSMLEASRHAEVTRFHHISTCEVYGDLPLDSDDAFAEDDPYRPRTPYNASKAGADHAVRAYAETFGTAATITNCSNNYGPYQFPEKVIPLFTAYALDDRPIPMYESTANRREWLHVVDHCRAVEAVLERGRVGETYHVGSGVEASIEQIADAVLDTLEQAATRSRRSCPTAPATTGAICSTAPRSRRSSAGPPRSPSRKAWPTRCTGTRPTGRGGSRSSTGRRWWRAPGARGLRAIPPPADRAGVMRVLVTGAGGQLGRDLVDAFSGRVPTAGKADDPATGRLGARSICDVVAADHGRLDVTDRGAVLAAVDGARPHVIVHAGAWTAVDACEADPDRAFAVNALGDPAHRRGGAPVGRPRRVRVHRLRLRRRRHPSLRGVGPDQPAVGVRAQQARRRAGAGPRLDRGADVVGVRRPRGQHGAHRAAPGRPARARCASSTTSGGARASPPMWLAPSPCSPPTGCRGRSTSPTAA